MRYRSFFNQHINKTFFVLVTIIMPFVGYAQTQPLRTTESFLGKFDAIVSGILIPLVFTLALLFFFWGVAKYIWSAGGEKEEGKKIMIWGVIALFVMSSVWGLVYFLRDELGLNQVGGDANMRIPGVQYGTGGGTGGSGEAYINPNALDNVRLR